MTDEEAAKLSNRLWASCKKAEGVWIEKSKYKAGVEGARGAFEVYRNNQAKFCDILSKDDWCDLQNSMFEIKTFLEIK